TAALQRAVSAIQSGTTQKEILRALLDNTVLYSGRAALFVVKNSAASGWNGVGFTDKEAIKDFALDIGCELATRTMQSRNAETGSASDFDQNFTAKFGRPAGDKIVLLPLLLKDKVSALVYADAGTEGGAIDLAALDVLVRATSAWLEVISQRKQAQKEGTAEPEAAHSAPSANDPFASHTPIHTAKAQSGTEAAPAAMSAPSACGGPAAAPGED